MEIDPVFASAHEDLIYEFESAGFRATGPNEWRGRVRTISGSHEIEIRFETGYPLVPPRVFVHAPLAPTWHQDSDGAMCLYPTTGAGRFPWLAHGDLIGRIGSWIESVASGWEGVPPDLDLERYWPRRNSIAMVIVWSVSVEEHTWIQFELGQARDFLIEARRKAPPGRRPGSHKFRYGLVVDIGAPSAPPRSWADVRVALAGPDTVESLIRQGRADVLLVRYTLGGVPAMFGLMPHNRNAADLTFDAATCAAADDDAMKLRRGPLAVSVSAKHVAIVGVGAVGSFVADGLSRAGVGTMTLIDGDRLRPGNLPRHSSPSIAIGMPKSVAVGAQVSARGTNCIPMTSGLITIEYARQLVAEVDLIVEATGDETISAVLEIAAHEQGKPMVSAYLTNAGRSLVVEVLPRAEASPPPSTSKMSDLPKDGLEAGCGDPVSPTPPYAVQELAAIVCRTAVQLLTGDQNVEPAIVREYAA